MPEKFDMTIEEAMKLLNLNKGFTENEFKSNYKEIMRNIHPDTLGGLNNVAFKILEDRAKDVNTAKQVIQAFINTNYTSEKNTYSKTNNKSNDFQQKENDEESKEKDYQEQNNTENRSKKQSYQEEYKEEHKEKIFYGKLKVVYTLWFITIILAYPLLKISSYKLTNLGQTAFMVYLIIPISIFTIIKNQKYKNNKTRSTNILVRFIYIFWFLTSISVYPLLNVNGYKLNDLGQIVFISYLAIPIIIFVFIKIIKSQKRNWLILW